MEIRKYRQEDLEQIACLFCDTVHTINIRDYSQEQVDAWATGSVNLEEWNTSFLESITCIATEKDLIVGFGNIYADGYLDKLYVHKDFQGKGIATAICNLLEREIGAKSIITVHASITARPFFEKRGYRTVRKQEVRRHGILLTNYIMEKTIV
ncbi:MAG: GNAT family N-acetyltransferase [Bacteroidales bacterium]|nr:GNAT family N-acetyltransferase [Bacteroidales bacterium]